MQAAAASHGHFLPVGFSVQDEPNAAHEVWQNASQSRPFALRAPKSPAKPLSLIQIIFCLTRLIRLPCLILECYSSVHNLSGECSAAGLGVLPAGCRRSQVERDGNGNRQTAPGLGPKDRRQSNPQ